MHIVKIGKDLAILRVQAPVIQQQNLITVDIWSIGFGDHQRPVQPAPHLFRAGPMGVIPIGARIRQRKVIVKLSTGRHSLLCQSRHPIHRVVNANAMPVH